MKTSTLSFREFHEGNILLKESKNDQRQNRITYSRSACE